MNRINLIDLFLHIIWVLWAWQVYLTFSIRSDAKRGISELRRDLQLRDKIYMNGIVLKEFASWLNTFQLTKQERDAYIKKYFPKNKYIILSYINMRYPL